MRKLAIVILNWNGAKMLRQYLPTVLENSVGDVIVADNASIDGSVNMLLTEFPQVQNIILEQNFGLLRGITVLWLSCRGMNISSCSTPTLKCGSLDGTNP